MIEYGKYVIIINIEEIKKRDVLWEDGKNIRVEKFGVFHLENANFPQCFKYVANEDPHCCGNYFPCDKTEMIIAIERKIKKLKDLKKSCWQYLIYIV